MRSVLVSLLFVAMLVLSSTATKFSEVDYDDDDVFLEMKEDSDDGEYSFEESADEASFSPESSDESAEESSFRFETADPAAPAQAAPAATPAAPAPVAPQAPATPPAAPAPQAPASPVLAYTPPAICSTLLTVDECGRVRSCRYVQSQCVARPVRFTCNVCKDDLDCCIARADRCRYRENRCTRALAVTPCFKINEPDTCEKRKRCQYVEEKKKCQPKKQEKKQEIKKRPHNPSPVTLASHSASIAARFPCSQHDGHQDKCKRDTKCFYSRGLCIPSDRKSEKQAREKYRAIMRNELKSRWSKK